MTQHDWEMLVLGDNLGRDSVKNKSKKKRKNYIIGNCIALIIIILMIFAGFCYIFNITITDIFASLYNLAQLLKGLIP